MSSNLKSKTLAPFKKWVTVLRGLVPLELKKKLGFQLEIEDEKRIFSRFYQTHRKNGDGQSSKFFGKKILFWELGGMPPVVTRDAVIAAALELRGADCLTVICDGASSACMQREIIFNSPISEWHKKCDSCLNGCRQEADAFDLKYITSGSLVSLSRRLELRDLVNKVSPREFSTFKYRGIDVGFLAKSSMIRYLKGVPAEGHDEVYREYLYASVLNTEAVFLAIEKFKPDYVFSSHGCYVDFGPALSVSQNLDLPVIVWGSSYLHYHSYMHTMTDKNNRTFSVLSEAGWEKRKARELSHAENERLERYLNARYIEKKSADLKLSLLPETPQQLKSRLDIPSGKKVWCIFTHLGWDNVFDFAPMAFPSVETG